MYLAFAPDAEATVARDIGIFPTATGVTDAVQPIPIVRVHVVPKAVINPAAAGMKAMCAGSKMGKSFEVYHLSEEAATQMWKYVWELSLNWGNIRVTEYYISNRFG